MNFDSFIPLSFKRDLVFTLLNVYFKICSLYHIFPGMTYFNLETIFSLQHLYTHQLSRLRQNLTFTVASHHLIYICFHFPIWLVICSHMTIFIRIYSVLFDPPMFSLRRRAFALNVRKLLFTFRQYSDLSDYFTSISTLPTQHSISIS